MKCYIIKTKRCKMATKVVDGVNTMLVYVRKKVGVNYLLSVRSKQTNGKTDIPVVDLSPDRAFCTFAVSFDELKHGEYLYTLLNEENEAVRIGFIYYRSAKSSVIGYDAGKTSRVYERN